MMEQYIKEKITDISIIIPIYNQEDNIGDCVNLILEEIKNNLIAEIILINDGSVDKSGDICEYMAKQYPEVKYFYQENSGVSAARNCGIRNAKGKYIFYLDADDRLKKGSILALKRFFDSVQDEVDLITYRIDTILEGRVLSPHFRYQYLKESGVYDLREYPYIGQTTMNIVVKNYFENNVLFDENQTFSEDQKYCCEILKDKLKMGFCSEGSYIYYRSNSSSSSRLSGACYIFEQCTDFFEEMFDWYEHGEEVPAAFQGLFVNDFYWKLCCNILFPYHYEKFEFENAINRLKKLLSRCTNEIILNHPQIDFFEKYYILRLKNPKGLEPRIEKFCFGLADKDIITVYENSIEIVMTKCQVRQNTVIIAGFLKSVFFQFYEKEPTLCAIENDGSIIRKLKVFPSAHNYYLSHEETQRFWAFTYECNIEEVTKITFKMGIDGCWYPAHYYFMPCIPFSHRHKRYTYTNNGVKIHIDKMNNILISQNNVSERKKIWLYYDCAGVACDNGLIQFLHDYEKTDAVVRYYIVSDKRQKDYLPNNKCGIKWGSSQHKHLFLKCHKILTGFIEEENIIPFAKEDYDKYSGRFHFEVVYLQHGVLHFDMPWKYTPERIMADRVVVSTQLEAELFCRNGFKEKELLKYRMPRLESKKKSRANCRKILFAPSWRSYLVGKYQRHKWEKLEAKFKASTYFRNIQELLNNRNLIKFLEQNDYMLEMKLHPIFSMYKECFEINSRKIKLVENLDAIENYSVFITDISSYAYDYLYHGIPVFWFIPDEIEFKSGMNGYHNIGEKGYWDRVSTSADELVEQIHHYVCDEIYDGVQVQFYEKDSPTEKIYQEEIRR